MRARFISLEGGEGVGKSTQARRLAETLAKHGIEAIVTREPGGSAGAEAIRELLLQGEGTRWNARAEALLFAAARADHVEKTIHPAIDRGQWVICDRFLDSSRAYQGGAGGLDDEAILTLHRIGSGNYLPDRTLLLTLPNEEAAGRADVRDNGVTDRIGGRGSQYHSQVTTSLIAFAKADPDRFRIVDASGAESEVTDRLMAAISDLLS